jgi:4-nitrophenyl phosphatase
MQQNITDIQALIIDMDGVLWRDDQPIGDLPKIFQIIESQPIKALLATNNSTRSIDQYLEKLRSFGVTLQPWQLINSSQATAKYLRDQYPECDSVYIIGEAGLFNALDQMGFYHSEENPQVVVVGMDRQLSYHKLTQATLLIRSGLPFIATNPDKTFPIPAGLAPGTGSLLAALEAATDQKPYVIGKPYPGMYQIALERLGTPADQTLVIGDRLETDIAGGQTIGCPTGLVLSGVTTKEQANKWTPPPNIIAKDLTALLEELLS